VKARSGLRLLRSAQKTEAMRNSLYEAVLQALAEKTASRAHVANAIRHIFKESDHLRYALFQCFHVTPMIEPLQSIS